MAVPSATKGNSIIVTANPMGKFLEGYVNAALKPGTVVSIDVSEGLGGDGRWDFEAWDAGADGDQRIMFILLEDIYKGKLMTDAYVSGDRCRVYIPVAGDELNMLIQDVAGTGDDHAIGDLLIVDDGTGELIATTGSPESEPFMNLTTITDPTGGDYLAWVMYTGY